MPARKCLSPQSTDIPIPAGCCISDLRPPTLQVGRCRTSNLRPPILAGIRAKVEHPFRVIKRQFGLTKVRYRGLKKNAAQVQTLFALSNLWMARRKLMASAA